MKITSKLAQFSLDIFARVNKKYGLDRAANELSSAFLEDSPKVLEVALSNCSRWLTDDEVNSIEITVSLSEVAWKTNWKGALIGSGFNKSIAWALARGKINPEEVVTPSPKTFRDYLWAKGGHLLPQESWTVNARDNPDKWKFAHHKEYKFSDLDDGFSWLKSQFVGSLDLAAMKNREDVFAASLPMDDYLPPPHKFYIKLSEFQDYILSDSEIEIVQDDLSEEINSMHFAGIVEKCSSTLGYHSDTYKSFVGLGWCTVEDVYKFQKWVEKHDKFLADFGPCWYRKDLVSWAEKILLTTEVCGDTPKLKQKASAL